MVKCKQCGNENAKDAKTCPKCGTALTMGCAQRFGVAVAAVLVLSVFSRMCSKEKPPATAAATTTPAATTPTATEQPRVAEKAPPTRTKRECVIGIPKHDDVSVPLLPTEESYDEYFKAAGRGENDRTLRFIVLSNQGVEVRPGRSAARLTWASRVRRSK